MELVYTFNERSTGSVSKGESTIKVLFKLFGGLHTYIL